MIRTTPIKETVTVTGGVPFINGPVTVADLRKFVQECDEAKVADNAFVLVTAPDGNASYPRYSLTASVTR